MMRNKRYERSWKMETDLVMCHQKQCKRYQVLVARLGGEQRCPECHSILKPIGKGNGRVKQLSLAGPLIDLPNYTGPHLPGMVLPEPEDDGVFTVDNGEVEGCPLAAKCAKPRLEIDNQLFNDWVFMANQLDTEWFAYLTGSEIEGGWQVTGMYFPKQRATGGHCVPDDREVREGTIGSVHSHVGMAARFSSTDRDHFNWPVELVINRSGDFDSSVRITLKCGSPSRAEAKVTLINCEREMGLVEQMRGVIRTPQLERSTQAGTVVTSRGGGYAYDGWTD
jgi:hypothetical protein